jgi:cell wall-associated NlpC family hydrolase
VIRRFLGAPYLWGGRTPLGFDCSGFVQQTLAAVGVRVPRDAHDQYLACRRLGRSRTPRLGDLLFFARRGRRMSHVGIVLGGGVFAHARGKVGINSLDSSNPLYDKSLANTLRAAGRP